MPQTTTVKVEEPYLGKTDVAARSIITGEWSVQRWDITYSEFYPNYVKWLSGYALIQEALPMLDSSQREFLMTGLTDADWEKL